MIGCVTNCQISCDHSNSELKVRYSSHGLNSEQAKVRNSNVSVIRMFAIRIPTVFDFLLSAYNLNVNENFFLVPTL